MTARKKHKPALDLFEQIEHLKKTKKVVFNDINEQKAREYLLLNNYINVISPFKYKFAKWKSGSFDLEKDKNGRHIYLEETDFAEYVKLYENERVHYSTIATSIIKFETAFAAVFSYHVITHYKINDESMLFQFFQDLKGNINSATPTQSYVKLIKRIEEFKGRYENYYTSIFNYFDSVSIGDRVVMYRLLPDILQERIFIDLASNNNSLEAMSKKVFDDRLIRVDGIRNVVFHCKSTTILLRYYDTKSNSFRRDTDRTKYNSLIKILAKQ